MSFEIGTGIGQGSVISLWLVKIYMYEIVREMKAIIGRKSNLSLMETWFLLTTLIVSKSMLPLEIEKERNYRC